MRLLDTFTFYDVIHRTKHLLTLVFLGIDVLFNRLIQSSSFIILKNVDDLQRERSKKKLRVATRGDFRVKIRAWHSSQCQKTALLVGIFRVIIFLVGTTRRTEKPYFYMCTMSKKLINIKKRSSICTIHKPSTSILCKGLCKKW